MAVNMKLGVDLSGFKQGISEANAQLKTFDAQIKLAERASRKPATLKRPCTRRPMR